MAISEIDANRRYMLYVPSKNHEQRTSYGVVVLCSDSFIQISDTIKRLRNEDLMVLDRHYKKNDFSPATWCGKVYTSSKFITQHDY